jgi:hypothetical protein
MQSCNHREFILNCFDFEIRCVRHKTWNLKLRKQIEGNKCLILEDFRYRFHKTLKNGNVSWRCSNKSCKATLKTDGENLMVVETNGEHCHESDKRKCERQQL